MSFTASFHYQDNFYEIEVWPSNDAESLHYTVKIGSELSMHTRTLELVPTEEMGSKKISWVHNLGARGGKNLSQKFIQAIGKTIERHA